MDAIIISIIVGFILGGIATHILFKKPVPAGRLRVAFDPDDNQFYLFLELIDDVPDVIENQYITLEVCKDIPITRK